MYIKFFSLKSSWIIFYKQTTLASWFTLRFSLHGRELKYVQKCGIQLWFIELWLTEYSEFNIHSHIIHSDGGNNSITYLLNVQKATISHFSNSLSLVSYHESGKDSRLSHYSSITTKVAVTLGFRWPFYFSSL